MKTSRRCQENAKADTLGKHRVSPSKSLAKAVQCRTATSTRVQSPSNTKRHPHKSRVSHCNSESSCRRLPHSQTNLLALAKTHSLMSSPKRKKLSSASICKPSLVQEQSAVTKAGRKTAKPQTPKKLDRSGSFKPPLSSRNQRPFNQSQLLRSQKGRSDITTKKRQAPIHPSGHQSVRSSQTVTYPPKQPFKKSGLRHQKSINEEKPLFVTTAKLQELLRQQACEELDLKPNTLTRKQSYPVLNITLELGGIEQLFEDSSLQTKKKAAACIQHWWKKHLNTEGLAQESPQITTKLGNSHESLHEESDYEQVEPPLFTPNDLLSPIMLEDEPVPTLFNLLDSEKSKAITLCAEAELVLSSEIDVYVDSLTFQQNPKEVDASYAFIHSFLDSLLLELMPEYTRILHVLNSPLCPDPSHKLFVLRMAGIGELSKVACFEMVLPPAVLPKLAAKHNPREFESQDTYIQLLLECINEALNEQRPYGTQGVPMPWSVCPRQMIFEVSLLEVFQQVRTRLATWCGLQVGLIGTQPALEQVRKKKQQVAVALDLTEQEPLWLDFEDEAMQTECDLADMVLEDLVDEIAQVLWH